MKKLVLAFMVFALSANIKAQETPKKMSFGIHVNRQQNNFGYGVNIGTGNILKSQLQFKVKANMSFIENANDPLKTTWNSFYNFNAGFAWQPSTQQNFINPYVEVGGAAVLTCFKFTEEKIHFGPYALAGFDVNIYKNSTIFFEMGAIYTGAMAERLINNPTYISGFLSTAGWRYNLK